MEKGKNKKAIILCILGIVVICLCILLLSNQSLLLNNPINIGSGDETKKLTDEEMNALYQKIAIFNDHSLDNYGYFYRSKEDLTEKNMDNRVKLVLAFNNLSKDANLDEEINYTEEEMENSLKEVLGDNATFEGEDFMFNCHYVDYDSGNFHYPKNSIGCGDVFYGFLSEVVSKEQKKDQVIIKEKYLYYEIDPSTLEAKVYSTYPEGEERYPFAIVTDYHTLMIDSYLDGLNTITYTFTKNDDGTYYLSKVTY